MGQAGDLIQYVTERPKWPLGREIDGFIANSSVGASIDRVLQIVKDNDVAVVANHQQS